MDKVSNDDFIVRGCNEDPSGEQNPDNIYCPGCTKLDATDWMGHTEPPEGVSEHKLVEVRFKHNRKDFFIPPPDMALQIGDLVAVEASPGHDIGFVTLSGTTAWLQMRKKVTRPEKAEFKKIYRRARGTDIEKWAKAILRERKTLQRTRTIAKDLNLEMKLNDVEFQGDATKAIFYYTAEDRVDFRQLIKVLAEEFRVRIEMRQIGVRQEASKLGGIGSCGRELCCSTWLTNFNSVSTSTAKIQQLALNPQKLAGQCGKLKCCLNYEYSFYVNALKEFPDPSIVLVTKAGEAFHQKSDIFTRLMWYYYKDDPSNILAIPLEKVRSIIKMNQKGKFPKKLEDMAETKETKVDFENVVGQDDLTRFDD